MWPILILIERASLKPNGQGILKIMGTFTRPYFLYHNYMFGQKAWIIIFSILNLCHSRPYHLRFVLSPTASVATETLLPQKIRCNRHEVCPEAGAIVQHMSDVIARFGGCALIADYGEYGSTRHTLRVSCYLCSNILTWIFSYSGEYSFLIVLNVCLGIINFIIMEVFLFNQFLFYTSCFQSFKNHKLYNVLEDPGNADVTANVDFEFLQKTAGSKGLFL